MIHRGFACEKWVSAAYESSAFFKHRLAAEQRWSLAVTMPKPIQDHLVAFGQKVRAILPWSVSLKLTLGALLGALGGAGFLGYLSEFATYSYAVFYGFRSPVEGIPYLKATVAFGSFFLLASGALIFSASLLLIRTFLWSFEWSSLIFEKVISALGAAVIIKNLPDFRHVGARFAVRPHWQAMLAAIVIAGMAGAIGYYEATLLRKAGLREISSSGFAAAMAGYGFLVTLALIRKNAIWWIAGGATVAYFLVWVVILFSPARYSEFLRLVGYGGGIPVIVEFRDPDQSSSYSRKEYYLMLRTTDALLLYGESAGNFIEVSRDQVRSITHASGGLRQLPYKLPR